MTERPPDGGAERPQLSARVVFVLFSAVFLACYFSVWSNDYGITDDYYDFFYGTEGTHTGKRIIEGRPLYAAIGYVLTSLATELEDLRWIRLIGIAGIALLAWSLYQALVRAGCGRFQSFCTGTIIGTSLPFQLCAAWATLAPWPFAAAVSGLAFLLADRAFDQQRLPRRWALAAGASLCLLAALAIYQPVAMFFWVFAAIHLLKCGEGTLRRFAWYCAIAAAGMAMGFVLYKLGPAIHPDSHYASRGGLIPIEDIPERIAWFVHPVRDALNFLLLQEMYRKAITPVTITLSLFIAISLILHLRGRLGQRLLKWGLALAFLFLSHAIMLVVERHAGGYRVLPALASLVVLYLYLASKGYAFHMARFLSPVRVNAIAGIAAAICVLAAAWQVQAYFVTPQMKELAFIRTELSGQDLSEYRGIHVIRPGPFDGFVPMQYAAASSRFPWAVPPMIGYVLRDLAPAHAGLPVTHSAFDDPSPPPQGSLVVDIGKGIAAFP